MKKYKNRDMAGQCLLELLSQYDRCPEAIVIGLARGGVPVAYEIALGLRLPLAVLAVRKITAPGFQEIVLGAIAPSEALKLNEDLIEQQQMDKNALDHLIKIEIKALQYQVETYQGEKDFPNLIGKTVILVDDGIATGASMHAAITSVLKAKPAKIVVAVPVASPQCVQELKLRVDAIICPLQPLELKSISVWYETFNPITDEAVVEKLGQCYSKKP